MTAQQNPLERYKVMHELGRGAIGTVYAARDRSTGAAVALKTLDPALFSESEANLVELFLKNARSAARLRHRNIVKVYDAGEAGGTAYVAMELLEGESLRHLLDNRPLSIARAIQIFDDIASALAYAHEEGMVHRGVRPSNIIVLPSGIAKIGDFGTGQIGDAALRYMSPEQVRGGPVDHRSDLFSLGVVFYEMLTRRMPFEGSSPREIKENILRAEPPLPSRVNPHVPGALDGIVSGMLAGDPDQRFANARILLRDLQRFEEGLGLGPGASAGEPAAPQAATKRELTLLTPDPDQFRDRVPMPDAIRSLRHGRAHDASSLPVRPDPSAAEAFQHDARFMMDRGPVPERSSGSRAGSFAALLMLAAVLGVAVFFYYSPGSSELRTLVSGLQGAPATVPAPVAPEASPLRTLGDASAKQDSLSIASAPPRPAAPPPVAEATRQPATAPAAPEASPPKPVLAKPSPPAKTESLPTRESSQPPAVATAPAEEARRVIGDAKAKQESSGIESAPKPLPPEPVAAKPVPPVQTERLATRVSEQPAQPAPKISEPQPGGTAKLIIAVSPQGELYIDGKHHGTTPPITTLDLEPGMHRIEIRSGSRKPFLTYMAVEAGDERRIRHDFAAKPSRPPH
jgi:serine/threonine-protein kinase